MRRIDAYFKRLYMVQFKSKEIKEWTVNAPAQRTDGVPDPGFSFLMSKILLMAYCSRTTQKAGLAHCLARDKNL